MKIIPAIDIIDGSCVRLTKGDYNQRTIYAKDPVVMAQKFEDAGLQYLHLVDLDGARAKHMVNTKVLEQICQKTNLQVDFGGGIKSREDAHTAFDCGASQITAGSIAVQEPKEVTRWIADFGSEKIILGADSKKRTVATSGWQQSSEWDVVDFISLYQQKGIQNVICTAIEKDGMLGGSAHDLYKEIITRTSADLIASGGVDSLKDLNQLKALGCSGAIIGKAIYEGKIQLKELEKLC